MEALIAYIQNHRPMFDAIQALSSVFNVVAWTLGLILLMLAWRRGNVSSVSLGPLKFLMQQEAVEATAAAARNWKSTVPGQPIDLTRIRETIGRAFDPKTADNLTGKAVLWVDDNPSNNELAVRALRKLGLDVEQETSTARGLDAMARRTFDLVISDMGRGTNMRAGYELLAALRQRGNVVPFIIFAGSDTPAFRQAAKAAGAVLSTNDMLELIDTVVKELGH